MRRSFVKQLLSRSKRTHKARPPRDPWTHLAMEHLEDRALLSVTTALSRGILSITADDTVNQVQVTQPTADQIAVADAGQTVGTFAADQVQLILFQQGAALSSFDNETALPAEQLRLWNSPRLSPAELSQTGSLDAVLVDDTLTLTGPSGAGFQVTGTWSTTDTDLGNGQVQHTFTASGDMVLKTAAGDLAFTASDQAPLTVVATGSVAAEFGAVSSAGGSAQILNTTDPANPLHRFQDMFGLQLNPGAVPFSIALGSSLGTLGVPLNNALPYLTFTTTNPSTAQFGTISATVGTGDPLTVAFDPEDPSLYARVNEFTMGGSLKGYIPYTAAAPLPHQNFGPIYGHLYGQGSIQPGDVPVSLTGAAVFNLDANQDGQLLSTLQGNVASQLVTGTTTLSMFAQADPADLMAAMNAHMAIGYTDNGFNMSIPADGSAVYTPGHLLSYGTTTAAVFANTPFAFVAPSGAVNVGADIDNQGKFYVRVRAKTGTVAGYNASHLKVLLTDQGTAVVASLNPSLPLGRVTIHGGVQPDGEFSLQGHADTTLDGFALTHGVVTLSNNGLGYRGNIIIPAVGPVALAGAIDGQGQLTLTGSTQVTLAGFALTAGFTLTNSSLAVSGSVNVDGVNVNLAGTMTNQGQYNLTGSSQVTVAGFALTAGFTLTNAGMAVSSTLNIPNIGSLTFAGTVSGAGQYSLSATTQLTVSGLTINATLALDNTDLTIAAAVNLPVVGNVNLSGTVDSQGHFALSANLGNINILFVTLTGAMVTLADTGLTITAHAAGLPLLGDVDFTGTVSGGSYTFTATLPSVSVLGFTLSNVHVTLDNTNLSVGAHATGIPLAGTVDFNGTVTAGGFSLSATATNVDLLGFIHFDTIALTLTNASLSLSATTNLPVVGNVTFTGAVDPSGSFTITATAPSFTLLGFLTFSNASVSLSLPDAALTVTAGIDLLNIGHVTFMGSITAGGHYSFTASASLTVAGFTLGTANLGISDAPAAGIVIGPFTTPPLPLVGPVTIQGSYGAGGQFSFMATIHPMPPIMIGPIPVDTIVFGLTNDSLTLGIGVGYNLGGFLDLTGSGQVTVYAPSAQHDFGDFDLLASVNVSIVGFSAVNGQMELRNTRGQFSFTVDAQINLLIATAQFHGEIDFNQGLVGFSGSANIGVAGFTLSNSNFLITNAQVQFVNGMWSFPHTTDGHLIAGNGIHIEVHSHTNLPNILAVNFDGTFAKSGTSYVISVHATANLTIAGFNLASASLVLDNTHLAISVHYVQSGVFTVDFSGTMSSTGAFSLSGSAALGLAGFLSVANASFTLDNTHLAVSSQMDLKLVRVNLSGTFQFNGQFSLTGSASVGLGGFNAVTGMFTLNNNGASVSATVNVLVATASFSGSIHTDGTYSLTGSAQANFIGFIGAGMAFTLTNSSLSVSGNINVTVGTVRFSGSIYTNGGFDLTGSGSVGFAGFGASGSFELYRYYLPIEHTWISGLDINVNVNVLVATVHFTTTIDSTGAFDMTGQATANFAGFTAANVSFRLRNSGLTIAASVNVFVATINIAGSILSNGFFTFTVNTRLGFAGFGATGNLTLSATGVSVSATLDIGIMGVHMSFSGAVHSNGTFSFATHVGLSFGPVGVGLDLTLSNTGFSAHVHADLDMSAGISFGAWSLRVGFRGSFDIGFGINTNGSFNAGGSFQMCGYLGVGVCVGIGFSITNNQFCIRTSQIGFSLWGVGFHPFGDLCFNY